MASMADRNGRGPRITLQLDRSQQEFLKAHRRQYGLTASWIIRRLIENQVASGRDLLGKPLAGGKARRSKRTKVQASTAGPVAG